MKKEDLIGKKVADLMDEDTKVLGGPYRDTYDITQVTIRDTEIHTYAVTDNNDIVVDIKHVIGDFLENLVMCFHNNKMVAIWNCYDLMHISLNGKRGLAKSQGHETVEEYWFDDGEFSSEYTR
ncbi:MAG: hypothetical protein AMJ56_07600 [Anaerolineae bacterium SG8_19]|nr:MAG: hypothetical protein AMJ56_07600 [Anaerolineae bacterium SG8_19]